MVEKLVALSVCMMVKNLVARLVSVMDVSLADKMVLKKAALTAIESDNHTAYGMVGLWVGVLVELLDA
jgi:hypothetical protein